MFDFVKGLFIWLVKKILFIFFPIIGWVVFFFENFSNVMESIWNFCTTWIIWYFQEAYIWLFDWFATSMNTLFADHDFAVSVVEFSSEFFTRMNIFLPMNETCACLSFILATQTAIFLLRLALKAIPTIW